MRRTLYGLVLVGLLAACGRDRAGQDAAPPSADRDEPPVALDPEPLVVYPPALYQQGIEGTVTLRLFVDDKGAVVRESTQVAESSGYPAFDSAAVAGVPKMHFSPAQRGGRPVAMTFSQPVHFRKPSAGGASAP
ncbi:MAG: energy transducer TonB [Gemmatimonadota bacterium]